MTQGIRIKNCGCPSVKLDKFKINRWLNRVEIRRLQCRWGWRTKINKCKQIYKHMNIHVHKLQCDKINTRTKKKNKKKKNKRETKIQILKTESE